MYFSGDDVARAYAARNDGPPWRGHDNPWEFYRPESILRARNAGPKKPRRKMRTMMTLLMSVRCPTCARHPR